MPEGRGDGVRWPSAATALPASFPATDSRDSLSWVPCSSSHSGCNVTHLFSSVWVLTTALCKTSERMHLPAFLFTTLKGEGISRAEANLRGHAGTGRPRLCKALNVKSLPRKRGAGRFPCLRREPPVGHLFSASGGNRDGFAPAEWLLSEGTATLSEA